MSDLFLTNPGNALGTAKKKSRRGMFFKFEDHVRNELMLLGVPYLVADVCLIDLRSLVTEAFHDKYGPTSTAKTIFPVVQQRYTEKDADGNIVKWHYT